MTTTSFSQPPKVRDLLAWSSLVGASLAAIAALLRLGDAGISADWPRLWEWMGEQAAEPVLLGVAHGLSVALASWVAASTLLVTAAHATGVPRLITSVEWMAVPPVRRLAKRVTAMSLAVTTASGLTPVAALATDAEVHRDEARVPVETLDERETQDGADVSLVPPPFLLLPPRQPRESPEDTPAPQVAIVPRPGPASGGNGADGRHTVRDGEHLWAIAAVHLHTEWGREPTESEIAAYWSRLIEANRERLRSGDPDLVFPGEILHLPPAEPAG